MLSNTPILRYSEEDIRTIFRTDSLDGCAVTLKDFSISLSRAILDFFAWARGRRGEGDVVDVEYPDLFVSSY